MLSKDNIGRRLSALITTLLLTVASFAPALLSRVQVSAAQLTNRSIAISNSKVSASGVTYSVTFKVQSATVVKGIVLDFCSNSPLIGNACTAPAGMVTPAASTITVTNTAGTGSPLSYTVDTTGSISNGTGRIALTDAGGITPNTANAFTFSFTATNTSALGTFYGRILTYSTVAGARGYVDTSPGSPLDTGGVAMSTADQLTINARVQEQLAFCVGTTNVDDATTSISSDCSVSFAGSCGTTVDIGVIDSTATNVSPVTVGNGGNGCNGAAMVRTNAVNGVTVGYFAVQAGSGTNHLGTLRVSGAACNAGNVNTDQCIDAKGGTQGTLAKGVENFGMTVAGINCGSTTSYTCNFAGGTYNMVRTADYDGDGTNTYNNTNDVDKNTNANTDNGYAWDESGATTVALANSSTVVDDEALVLKFAATANITTPTGTYGVTSTYIATATY